MYIQHLDVQHMNTVDIFSVDIRVPNRPVVTVNRFTIGFKVVDSVPKRSVIHYNNSTVIYFAKNNKSGTKSKHIDVKHFIVKERHGKQVFNRAQQYQTNATGYSIKGLPFCIFNERVQKLRSSRWFIIVVTHGLFLFGFICLVNRVCVHLERLKESTYTCSI